MPILKRQGSQGITIESPQKKMIFDFQVDPYWLKWQTKRSKPAANDFETSKIHPDTWNRYVMLGFVSAHRPWNASSHLELRRSCKALREELVLLSATTLSNICRRGYALTVDAMKNPLPSRNNVSLALDGWTSTNKLEITLVIANYMDRKGGFHELQLAFDEVDHLFFSRFES